MDFLKALAFICALLSRAKAVVLGASAAHLVFAFAGRCLEQRNSIM